MAPIELFFDRGTLLLKNLPTTLRKTFSQLKWDERVLSYRAPANNYYDIALYLHKEGIPFLDNAKQFEPTRFHLSQKITPRNYQQEALDPGFKQESAEMLHCPLELVKRCWRCCVFLKRRVQH